MERNVEVGVLKKLGKGMVQACGKQLGRWGIRKVGHLVSFRFSFMVGNRQRVSFWKDKWCGAAPLCDSFPALFAIATFKEALVEDVWIASESEEKGGS